MNKRQTRIDLLVFLLLLMFFSMGITANAEEDSESVDLEQTSFVENDGQWFEIQNPDQYVDGIYNINQNARASMTGVIRLYQSGSTLAVNYSTVYTYSVDKLGVKNVKLQYKGSLGLWHTIITIGDRYRENAATYQGGFSCDGVIGRTYRAKGTHYVIDGSYTETRDNVTDGLTFR